MTKTRGNETKIVPKDGNGSKSAGFASTKTRMKLKAAKTKLISKMKANGEKKYKPTTKKDTISKKEIKFQILIPIEKVNITDNSKKTKNNSQFKTTKSVDSKTKQSKQKVRKLQQKPKGTGIAEKKQEIQMRSKNRANSLGKKSQKGSSIHNKTRKATYYKVNQRAKQQVPQKKMLRGAKISLEEVHHTPNKKQSKVKSKKKGLRRQSVNLGAKKNKAKANLGQKNNTKNVIEVDSNSSFFLYNNSLLKTESSQKEEDAKTAQENLAKRIYLLDFQREDDCWTFKLMDKMKKICTCKITPNLDNTCQLSCACQKFKQGEGKACPHLYFIVKQIGHCEPVLDEFQRDGSVCDVGFWQLNMSLKIALHSRYTPEKNPSIEAVNNKLCYICMQKMYKSTQDVKECPKCQRQFHSECKSIWTAYKPTCPLCQTVIPKSAYDEQIVLDMTNIEF